MLRIERRAHFSSVLNYDCCSTPLVRSQLQKKKSGTSTMRINLFTKGDSVLLLGEGNFSFSVDLHKHQLPIKIVATCFESELRFEHQKENIEYLKSNNVPVFLNVDATKLHENTNFLGVKFSKIVFNFPHVGGKMKIHLNRELLRKMFESCSKLIGNNGAVLVSLCRGQGGTPADEPPRRWDDTWQITEMAAHGDFVLTGVEPFLPENFSGYKCVGYRGNDVRFGLTGALVHIFQKREPPCPCLSESLNLVPLSQGSDVLVPGLYAELYQSSPIGNPHSHISFFEHFLVKNLSEISLECVWSRLTDDDFPVYVSNGTGIFCQVGSEKRALRSSPSDVLPHLLKLSTDFDTEKKKLLFPGNYFNPLKMDFLASPPLEVRFVILGANLSVELEKILNLLIDLFKSRIVKLSRRVLEKDLIEKSGLCLNFSTGFSFENPKAGTRCPAALVYEVARLEIAIINAQLICQYFFEIGWREIWVDKVEIDADGRPSTRPTSLYPSCYEFDITLRSWAGLCEDERVGEVIWLAVGRLVEGVRLVNEYTSAEGWSSKCYRITYKSFEKPLHRARVLGIHSAVVGRALELGLNVKVI